MEPFPFRKPLLRDEGGHHHHGGLSFYTTNTPPPIPTDTYRKPPEFWNTKWERLKMRQKVMSKACGRFEGLQHRWWKHLWKRHQIWIGPNLDGEESTRDGAGPNRMLGCVAQRRYREKLCSEGHGVKYIKRSRHRKGDIAKEVDKRSEMVKWMEWHIWNITK